MARSFTWLRYFLLCCVILLVFTFLLALITFAEISTGIWALIKHQKIEELPLMDAKKAFSLATTDNKKIWDRMQSRLGCCGLHGKTDYADSQGPPWSCFKVASTEDSQDPDTIYKVGCLFSAISHTRSVLLNVFLTALGSVLLQICFLIAAACYLKAVRKKKEKRKQEILETARSAKDSDADNQTLKSKTLRSF
ncbi:leukocyte surface antigen CD53-like [Belonocnema kinseyi]|uniref:leukocyte surface antigen CD53-like n=1 Tax=Belonocnema kinseyi TaxID=2817044 RepID=UPI00143DBA00|nr:leukocyte surface antigen CD53-like [Belonocnema kinseyi]